MRLTPQARRLLSEAVEAIPDQGARTRFREWVSSALPTAELPYEIASIAFQAVTAEVAKLEKQLGEVPIDDDAEADIINDLGYVQAIEKSLRLEGVGR